MPDMKVFLELIAKSDKFQSGFAAGERSLKSFQGFAQRTGQFVSDLTQKFGMLGTAATALSTGLVLKKLFSLSDYLPIDDALLRMRVNLKATGAEMDAFKKKVAYLAGDVGGDVGEVFQSAYKLSFNYNKDDILQIIKESDRAADAMKAPRDVVQDRIVQIMKLKNLPASEARGVADALVASRVNVESLETLIQRLALKGGAKKGYIEELGMLRGLNIAGLENPRAIMSLYTVLGEIQKKAYILESKGIKVKGRDQLDVLKDLEAYMLKMQKTHSEAENIKQIEGFFGAGGKEAMDFVFSQMENFKRGREEMAHAREIAAERNAAAEKTWGKQLEKIKGQLGGIKTDLSFIYDLAKNPVKFFADHPEATKTAGYTAAGVSGAVLVALGYGGIKKIAGGVGKTGLGIATGKVLEEATGVTPVFVTNMPKSGIDSVTKTGLLTKIGALSLPALAGAAAYSFYKYPGLSGTHSLFDSGVNKFSSAQDKLLDEARSWGAEHGLQARNAAPMYYNEEYKRNGDKNNFVFNFKIDKDGRTTGDFNNADADFVIKIARGDFEF